MEGGGASFTREGLSIAPTVPYGLAALQLVSFRGGHYSCSGLGAGERAAMLCRGRCSDEGNFCFGS